MDKVIVDSVYKIANHIYKKKGYMVTIKREDVVIILNAIELLNEKIVELGRLDAEC